MHSLGLDVHFQGQTRMVNGIPVERMFDAGIIFEKESQLQLAIKHLSAEEPLQYNYYAGFDRKYYYQRLASGAVVGMTHASGPAFAASAVERGVRSGADNFIRIGTSGGLQPDLNIMQLSIVDSALADNGTTQKYMGDKRQLMEALIEESVHPLGKLYDNFQKSPWLVKKLLTMLNGPLTLDTYTVKSDENLVAALTYAAETIAPGTTRGASLTNDARYLENPHVMGFAQSRGVKTIDMESSAIIAAANRHGLAGSSINIIMDRPNGDQTEKTTDLHEPKEKLATQFHGITDHKLVAEQMPNRIITALQIALSALNEITRMPNYNLSVNSADYVRT